MGAHDYTGKVLGGKYQVTRLLGEGGMGAVYLAEHVAIGKPVAVKFLHAELASREEVVKRFFREAQAAAAIRHPNIIDVGDLGVSDEGEPYLVMEYLQGESLGDRLVRGGAVDLPTACGILEATLVALDAAHEKGVVHRDLKPDNIFLVYQKGGPAGVKLIDFGISKFAASADQTKLTQDGAMLGTPAYMSPEQIRGLADIDHRTDLYSVGVIFYEMLTGDLPFPGETYNELLVNALTTEPRPPTELNPAFPAAALPVVDRALAKSPEDRFQTAEEMLEAIRGLAPMADRLVKLTTFGEELRADATATGDLGKSQIRPGDPAMASNLLSQLIGERAAAAAHEPTYAALATDRPPASPDGTSPEGRGIGRGAADRWVRALAEPLGPALSALRRRRALQGALAAVVVAAVWLMIPRSCGEDANEDTVLITVRGAPKKAKIFYDDSLVTVNPFRVKRGDALVPLRVHPPRGDELSISIAPTEDRVVDVKDLQTAAKKRGGQPASAQGDKEQTARAKTDRSAEVEKAAEVEKGAKPEADAKKTTRRRRFDFPWPRRRD